MTASSQNTDLSSKAKTRSKAHLWDMEPSLCEMAETITLERTVPPDNPMPEGMCWASAPPAVMPAVNLSTRKLKVGLWGPPEQLTLSLGKTDVWDRRQGWEKPLTLEEIRQGTFSPANAGIKPTQSVGGYLLPEGGVAERYRSHTAYNFPCPKPVGQVILRCPDLAGANQPQATIRCADGTARLALRHGRAALEVTCLAMMPRNLIAIHFAGQGLEQPLSLRLYRHQDTSAQRTLYRLRDDEDDYAADAAWNGPFAPPEAETDGRFFWIRQRFPAEKTFPEGFEYVLMGLIVGSPATLEAVNNERDLGTKAAVRKSISREFPSIALDGAEYRAPGSAATAHWPRGEHQGTALVVVVTSAESASPLAEARRQLLAAEKTGMEGLIAENAAWFKGLYERRESGRVFSGSAELTCRNFPAIFQSWCAALDGMTGGFLTHFDPTLYEADEGYAMLADTSPFHGLPCYNEIYCTGQHVLNRSDRVTYWPKLANHWLAAAKKNAREVFNLPGAFGPAHGYLPPIKADEYAHCSSIWEFCMESPAQVLRVAWDTWDYGGDERYLAEQVYPALRELAIFYAAYVSLGEDGRYHVIPTVSAEHWGWTYRFARNRDSTSALSLFRWALQAAVQAAELLGRDAELREGWRQTAMRMAPYPTTKDIEEQFRRDQGAQAEVDAIQGDCVYPAEWALFGPVGKDTPEPDFTALAESPAELVIGSQHLTARTVAFTGNRLDLGALFDGRGPGKTAYLLADVEVDRAMDATFGAGADWWMKWWVNGEVVCDTLKDGNCMHPPSLFDHKFTVRLKSGRNRIAVKVVSGGGSFVLAAGGPRELRREIREPAWLAKIAAEGPVYCDVAGVNPFGNLFNYFHGVAPTLLADQIHLDSDPAEIDTMLRTAQLVGGWQNQAVFHLLGAYPGLRKGVLAMQYFDAKPDEPIDTAEKLLAVVAVEPERLLNSRSGRIHLFPCVPKGSTVAFRNFQARGGFLVSAEMREGRITFVRIAARRDVACQVMNPWPGQRVVVRREGDGQLVPHEVDTARGECLVFDAQSGCSYLVEVRQ